MEISYKGLVTIFKEKSKYKKIKKNMTDLIEKLEEKTTKMRVGSVNLNKRSL